MMRSRSPLLRLALLTLLALLAFALPGTASADSSGGATGAPAAFSAAATSDSGHVTAHAAKSNGNCSAGALALNALNPFSHCNLGSQAVNGIGQLPGDAAGLLGSAAKGIAGDVMDQVTAWMVGAAQTISGWVVKEAGAITTPDLNANWYSRLFAGLAALGGVLAGLVGLIALGSAAIRRDPDAVGEVIYGIARAGIGTSIVIALTIIALAGADGIANDFARQMPADFYKTLADQWGGSGWGGFGAAALAFLVAFVATIAGLLVWLELIVREAAIYLAVLFFPIGLAASIWPALRSWVRRLSMLLLMFVLLRPVVIIVLALAGSVTASGLSFGNGSIPHSVGTILAGTVIFALAAFTPWALMFVLGTEVGVRYSRGGASRGQGTRSAGTGHRAGGALVGEPALAGGGALAMGGGGGEAAGAGRGGETGLASLGGSGSGGAAASGGSIAAAAGWVGAAAGAAARVGGHLGQHAAARIQVAAGRSGVAPGGLFRPDDGGLGGGGPGTDSRTADQEHREPPSGSRDSSSSTGGLGAGNQQGGAGAPADALSSVDTTVAPSPPSAERQDRGRSSSPSPDESAPPAGEPPERRQ